MLYFDMDNLQKEKQSLSKTNNDVQAKLLQLQQLQLITIRVNVNCTMEFYMMCLTIFTFLSVFMTRTSFSDKFLHRDQLLMTPVKLHLDLPLEFLALQCGLISMTA